MNSFTAIDFETANGYRYSICQIGLVRVENGIITQRKNLLVQPPNNYYWKQFTEIHGITPKQTKNELTFNQIWNEIEPFISSQNVVAHNGISFDFVCLRDVLKHYGLPQPEYTKHDTFRIFKKRLNLLCKQYNIPLNHHDALSDAEACARLFMESFNLKKSKKL